MDVPNRGSVLQTRRRVTGVRPRARSQPYDDSRHSACPPCRSFAGRCPSAAGTARPGCDEYLAALTSSLELPHVPYLLPWLCVTARPAKRFVLPLAVAPRAALSQSMLGSPVGASMLSKSCGTLPAKGTRTSCKLYPFRPHLLPSPVGGATMAQAAVAKDLRVCKFLTRRSLGLVELKGCEQSTRCVSFSCTPPKAQQPRETGVRSLAGRLLGLVRPARAPGPPGRRASCPPAIRASAALFSPSPRLIRRYDHRQEARKLGALHGVEG